MPTREEWIKTAERHRTKDAHKSLDKYCGYWCSSCHICVVGEFLTGSKDLGGRVFPGAIISCPCGSPEHHEAVRRAGLEILIMETESEQPS